MRKVWSVADSIVSPLGFSTQENYLNVRKGVSGVRKIENNNYSPMPLFVSEVQHGEEPDGLTRFEWLCSKGIANALQHRSLPSARTLFVLSSTKGNIDRLERNQVDHPRIHLPATAQFLATRFGFENSTVVSNACVSGILALIVAKRLIESGRYDHAVVVGADVLSQFVVSGFQSLHALSAAPCKPFDQERTGINLGEAAAVMVLSGKPEELDERPGIQLVSEGLSNDANHISGPSRTGEELAQAIGVTLNKARVKASDLDVVSAHGTATFYNDEMEAKAFTHAALQDVPLIGLKGYYGHTLGAAGVLETVMTMQSLLHNELVPTLGFHNLGVSQKVNVCNRLESKPLHTALKTGSGFGGCNAALILRKE